MKRFRIPGRPLKERGFALVITILMMALLILLVVGLLSLTTISLRDSARAQAMREARANARMALMLALGQLQKQAGPDQRITAAATVANEDNPAGVTGVWKSWRPPSTHADYAKEKRGRFTGYLISSPDPGAEKDPAKVPQEDDSRLLVGPGSVGADHSKQEVRAPLIAVAPKKPGAAPGALAWVTLDEGVKGRIDLMPADEEQSGLGDAIARMGSPARNMAGKLTGLEFLDGDHDRLKTTLPALVSTGEVGLASSDRKVFDNYFHDFSVSTNSVQADVAAGGLKTDLSVLFDSTALPADYATRRLYSGTSAPFLGANNADPMWAAYQHYYRLYQRTTANDNPRDGMKASVPTSYRLVQSSDQTLKDVRIEPNLSTLKQSIVMPTVSRVDIAFSLVARDTHANRSAELIAAGYLYQVHLMYLPVITLHNPYNVPLRFTELELEFSDLPIGFQFFVNNQSATTDMKAMNSMFSENESGTNKKTFKISLSGDLDVPKEVVMGPGETRIFGKPFPADWSWSREDAGGSKDGVKMFDWKNDKTQSGNRMMPGMITGPNDGVGYDLDWLAPLASTRSAWLKARTEQGVLPVKPSEEITVKYGPKSQRSSPGNKFSVTLRMKNGATATDYATTQVFFKDEARLKQVLEEGSSPRFPEKRSFPESFPKPDVEAPVTAASIYESNKTEIKDYSRARPFAIFSLSGKTTQESFTRSRPAADTGAAPQMATCEFVTSGSQGTNAFEFTLTPVRAGTAAIESEGDKAFFFGGQGAARGTTAATFYEIPMAPLQSLAQLRHANAGTMATAPYFTYTVGESRAHPALPADAASLTMAPNRVLLDHAWLANDQLWDRYWFSTLATLQGTAYPGSTARTQVELARDFFNGTAKLPNARNFAYVPAGLPAGDAATSALTTSGLKSAGYVMTRGGFNVNSTSEAAWISVLSALSDAPVPLATGSLEKTGSDVPILRTRCPSTSAGADGATREELWNSYRKLTPGEVKTLAKEMVKQVRARGPFLSMADFVNRSLTADADGLSGALQTAIDQSGINAIVNENASIVDPAEITAYGWKNPTAIAGTSTGAGSPGDITQGDVLSAIGSFVTVRSDTFRIRCYGESRSGDGTIAAQAWCEAIVQRLPEYLDPADDAAAAPAAPVNVAFGRRITTVAFRWLHPEEV